MPSAASAATPPAHDRQPANAPDEAVLRVEIPAGGAIKYESDAEGRIFVDRFLSMPMAYPANDGSMPGTRAGDGDPLDALVVTGAPLQPGVLIRFRPLGVLRMLDGGDADEKIIGVPADDVDSTYAGIRSRDDLPGMERARIEAFFRVHKDLPVGGNPVELRGWGGVDDAKAVMRSAMDGFDAN
ncbi:inorganic diphosphatase [Luteimonas sp. 3794]|uniref:inorganic diphosphatase n=1 Tax=Luteimonas sp. 3794 TaxID=2817730 RepID=UPI00286D1DBE|nr:inorganic diphosphatase [Luteimonas sp. 3794]